MSVKERLIEFLKFKKVSQAKFAETIGVSSGYVNAIRTSIQPDKIQSITTHYPDLNTEWLLTGHGTMLRQAASSLDAVQLEGHGFILAPLVTKYAYAGYVGGYGDDEYVESLPKIPFIIPEEQTTKGQYKAFEVRGDSMDDGSVDSIMDGDMLLCRQIKPELWHNYKLHLKKWNFVIVHSEGILIKRIIDHNVEKGTITIHSLNDQFDDQILNLNEVYQIFNVVQLQRKPTL